MIKTINLNGREISYNLERKNVKNINLRISHSINVLEMPASCKTQL